MAEISHRVPESGKKSGWTPETTIDYLLAIINEKHAQLISVIEGNDRRYEERFLASQKALELGLAAQKSEISAALAAADRAVSKAETATEKRFESTNEFRGQMADQQRTLIQRSEVDVLMRSMNEKQDASVRSLDAKIDLLQKAQDATVNERMGIKGGWAIAVGALGFVTLVGGLFVLVLNFLK
jgi:hypothetical protein